MKTTISNSALMCAALILAGCGSHNSQPAGAAPAGPAHAATPIATPAAASQITFSDLAIPPKPSVTPELLARGKEVYEQNCAACHGVKGDAQAPAAAFLLPKPRNFVQAKYRLRTTVSGTLPTDTDLYRSISYGLAGTPMPPWRHILNESERWAVVEYVKGFSPRFADPAEERDRVVSLGTPPARNAAAIAAGQELFVKMACTSCHGESGRGDGLAAAGLLDDAGLRIKPRDFGNPAGFKSGYSAKEIARVILTGFDGTPMVGFEGTLPKEDAWKIAYYVETLAKPPGPALLARASQNFLVREELGEPDVRIKLTERAWQFDPPVLRVKKDQIVEITFEPTDNGLGVGHGFAISSYDEVAFVNGAMVGVPKTVKFRADRTGQFTYYCSTQCSTDKLHPLMNGTLFVEAPEVKTASAQ